MSDDFNLEDWLLADIPEEPKTFEQIALDSELITAELAFHEASHLVFDCLLLKHVPGFRGINHANICNEKIGEIGWNVVNGVQPDFPDTWIHDSFLKRFYTEDKKRLVARLMSRLAGYASYQLFVENSDYCISVLNEARSKLNYYKLETVPLNLPSGDFTIAKKYLTFADIKEFQAIKDEIKIFWDGVQELMNIQAIRDSIIFVTRQLLIKNCEGLKGIELAKIVREVQRLTNKVPYSKILEKLEARI